MVRSERIAKLLDFPFCKNSRGMSNEMPKIIVDEDWKAEVQAEREKLRGGASEPSTGPRDAAASDLRQNQAISRISFRPHRFHFF